MCSPPIWFFPPPVPPSMPPPSVESIARLRSSSSRYGSPGHLPYAVPTLRDPRWLSILLTRSFSRGILLALSCKTTTLGASPTAEGPIYKSGLHWIHGFFRSVHSPAMSRTFRPRSRHFSLKDNKAFSRKSRPLHRLKVHKVLLAIVSVPNQLITRTHHQ